MRIRYDQLGACLRDAQNQVFIVSGDEPFQRLEAQDRIREALRTAGYDERQVLAVEPQFQWAELSAASENLSLFSTRKLIELRVPSGKLGVDGAKFLAAYRASEDRALMIELPRLTPDQQKSAWLKHLESIGVLIQVWPIGGEEFRAWLARRARSKGLALSNDALTALAERSEGNLLSAAQEIDMLVLLHENGECDLDTVLRVAGESARYETDQLIEAALEGDLARSASILWGLRAESAEPILLNWNIARMLREMAALADGGRAPGFNRSRRYQAAVRAAQRRREVDWGGLLRQCARIDRINKGAETGRNWDQLLELLMRVCGASTNAVP